MLPFDRRFSKNKLRYLLQCILATASAMLVLMLLNTIVNKVVIASLGASCFIAFCVPHHRASSPRFLIGGYIVGIAAGTLCYWLAKVPWPDSVNFLQSHSDVIFGGLAIGLAMFGMVVTNTEHPPAASLALGLVLSEWHLVTVAVALLEIVMLCILKKLLKPILINLL
ncbi:MAG: HPP family protein [Phycisphaerae bacterium]|nr:HPP family protein [Phycisphaerae bacterium]